MSSAHFSMSRSNIFIRDRTVIPFSRPQNKRLKAQKEMIESLSVGDEVIASGGMVCVITKMNDDFLTVRANDTVLTIQRESVSNVLPKGTIKSL